MRYECAHTRSCLLPVCVAWLSSDSQAAAFATAAFVRSGSIAPHSRSASAHSAVHATYTSGRLSRPPKS